MTNVFVNAWHKRQEEDKGVREQRHIELSQKVHAAFTKWLDRQGVSGLDYVVDGSVITIAELALVLQADLEFGNPSGYWLVCGICPECKQETISNICSNLADIGQQIEEFTPNYEHPYHDTSDSVVVAATWQERLAEAIAEAVIEVSSFSV